MSQRSIASFFSKAPAGDESAAKRRRVDEGPGTPAAAAVAAPELTPSPVPRPEAPKAEEPKEAAKAEEPKAEEPKAEEPKAEAPKAATPKAKAPKGKALKGKTPKADKPKTEKPKAEAVKAVKAEGVKAEKAEEPKAEAPKAEEPKAEAPKAEEPKAEAPKAEEPKAEAPKAEEPKAEAPKAEEPKAEAPKVEEPKAEAPKVEAPAAPKAAEGAWPTGEALVDAAFHPGAFAGRGAAPFLLVAGAFSAIEALKGSGSGSKKKQTLILTNLYRTLLVAHPADLVPALYMTVNKLAPDYENLESGIGDQVITRVICEVYGRTEAHVKNALATEEATDLGEVAMQSRVNQKMLFKPKPLTLAHVFAQIRSLADQKGKDSVTKRKDVLKKLLVAAEGEEPKFIVRSLQGKLRIGAQKQTVLQALAHAFVLTRPQAAAGGLECDVRDRTPRPTDEALEEQCAAMDAAVKQAFSSLPSFDEVAAALVRGVPPEELTQVCSIRVGIPVAPMLAKPTKGVTEILDRFQTTAFTAEWKYDGERAQVHISGDTLNVYSRNSENTTSKYPDVVEAVRAAMLPGITDCIIDAEVVAYDPAAQKILPFQTLTTRKRKNESIEDIQVCVCVYAFDLIFLNGESLCHLTLAERRSRLHASLREVENKLTFAKFRDVEHGAEDRGEQMEAFLQESIDGSCEGLMLKTLRENATYEPSRRSLNWLKLKKDYLEGMGDSVDLVVLGAFYGKGKRGGTYGAFLLGVYNADEEVYQSCCKVGTGFSDQDLTTHHAFFKDRALEEMPCEYDVSEKLKPDVWFEPVQVWECKAADLQISPVHSAARGAKADGKGIGLRFPRFLRVREDKAPENATSAEQIVEMFEAQSVQQNNAGDEDEDD